MPRGSGGKALGHPTAPSRGTGPAATYYNAPTGAPPLAVPDLGAMPTQVPELGNLKVDTDHLRLAVESATMAQQQATAARDKLPPMGSEPWGHDPGIGSSFGAVYKETHDALIQIVHDLPDLLQHFVDNLSGTQKGFADIEDDAVTAVVRLNSAFDPAQES